MIHHIRKQLKNKQIEKIMECRPGRELDALVAEYVMGLSVERWSEENDGGENSGDQEAFDYWYWPQTAIKMIGDQVPERVPNYSTVLFSAMQIVSRFPYWTLQGRPEEDGISASLTHREDEQVWIRGCETIPEAICKAALIYCVENDTFIDKLLDDH